MAAPIAHFDDDWSILGDLNMVSDQRLLPQKERAAAAEEAAATPWHHRHDSHIPPLLDGGFSLRGSVDFKTTEDLVKDFDETLSLCFRNVNAKTDTIAPVSVIAEDTLLETDE